jgi:CobB/CobQ-like glutamine amidotransferase domain
MPDASGDATPYHLSWRANGDSFDVALAVNRVLAAGGHAWRLRAASNPLDAGDYLIELTASQRAAIADLGLKSAPWEAPLPGEAQALNAAAPLLFAGTASRFPYYAYYALCLLRLGVVYTPCDGATLSGGALDDANLLILPGGFSNWGIDNAESVQGADARVRDFLAQGGAAIGSCGGAFYLSMGRPGWTGTAQAKPLYTHEYLQSGVGVVTLEMRDGPIALGCPPTMEVPYYHGPIYDLLGPGIVVAATFRELTLPGRLAIDNPLDRDTFQRDMAGKPAILLATGNRGRAVLFSPHPEMGDLIRKYIALDGYVRHYLPIRGVGTMRDTLRHYRICDAPSFRLVQNAIDALMTMAPKTKTAATPSARAIASARGDGGDGDLIALCRREVAALPDFGAGDEGDLLRDVAARAEARIAPVSERAVRAMTHVGELAALRASWNHLAATMEEHFDTASERTPAQQLMELELSIALVECWTRVAELDLALAGHA